MLYLDAHTHHNLWNGCQIVQQDKDLLDVWNSVGVHPWKASQFKREDVQRVLTDGINLYTIAIGEVGMDAFKGGDLAHQYEVFVAQVLFAERLNLPVIIHCVRCWEWVLKAYNEVKPLQKWVFHGFNKKNLLQQVLKCEGIQISIGANLLNTSRDQQWINEIPLDRLLLETDTVNVDIKSVYESVRNAKAISLQDLTEQIHINFKNTFTKWHSGWSVRNC